MRPIRRGFAGDVRAAAAFNALMEDVFGRDAQSSTDAQIETTGVSPFGIFDADGHCIAGLELISLTLVLNGVETQAAGIASVAVTPVFRGRGLFKLLIRETLACCERPVLLYAEEPALYQRFGFNLIPQHRFEGPPPEPWAKSGAPARWFSPKQDCALLGRLLTTRTPVSNHAALDPGASIFIRQIAGLDDYALDYLPDQDALVIWRDNDAGGLTLAGILAPRIPPLAAILAALNRTPQHVEILFPPDKLRWAGQPVAIETGLMLLGNVPAALQRPFMFSPAAEF